MILVSACLVGCHCQFDGDHSFQEEVKKLIIQHGYLTVCPEHLGGIPSPRKSCEIKGGDGIDVWKKKAHVLTQEGQDFAHFFKKGAQKVLELTQNYQIRIAILKSHSPSCGSKYIYDGHFKRRLKPGLGVTTALLQNKGIKVFSEKKLPSDEIFNTL